MNKVFHSLTCVCQFSPLCIHISIQWSKVTPNFRKKLDRIRWKLVYKIYGSNLRITLLFTNVKGLINTILLTSQDLNYVINLRYFISLFSLLLYFSICFLVFLPYVRSCKYSQLFISVICIVLNLRILFLWLNYDY